MVHDIEIVVVGAGVIGLAIARELAVHGHEVLIVEKNKSIGEETSSRNSEVIHAGIYYKRNSLKSRLCLEGRDLLYEYCLEKEIPHNRMGKLIVASNPAELDVLEKIRQLAIYNGVDDLTQLDRKSIEEIEPELEVKAALMSPSSGVVDTHTLMMAMLSDAESNGADIALKSKLERGVASSKDGLRLIIGGGDNPDTEINAGKVILASGLWTHKVAASLGVKSNSMPDLFLVKGNYFSVGNPPKFNHMVYPIPSHDGLGIHMTIDLAGQVKFGPDSEKLANNDPQYINYGVDSGRAKLFYDAIRKYWPGLKDGALFPDYAGVRPKISLDAAQDNDFCIHGEEEHGIRNLICLYGMESPGLTACLTLAREVRDRIH